MNNSQAVLRVYAYGIKTFYSGPTGEPFRTLSDGRIQLFEPFGFLHYWIDDELNYHECFKKTNDIPKCFWIEQSKLKVELRGPRKYTIGYAEANQC